MIEYIGRETKNHRNVIVNAIGQDELQHILDLADTYHNENMDKLTFNIIEKQIPIYFQSTIFYSLNFWYTIRISDVRHKLLLNLFETHRYALFCCAELLCFACMFFIFFTSAKSDSIEGILKSRSKSVGKTP